ncbi:hypothetical protein ACFS6H_19830 [Terrimonas rubra]|uniref:Uncharacterized protein n=1 Tax=Terrimonas rubra TaxID=1035890 RepID=A0ABW6AC17_9BACT
MKYVIVNEVRGIKYFWNEDKERWEGLEDNATKYKTEKDAKDTIDKQNRTAETKFHNAVKLSISRISIR